jgi:carbon monoxide dehydrogenase subunit G
MQLDNQFTVPAPIDEAWQTLLDVERIAPCIPGATLDTVDGDECTGQVKVKLGPIALAYKGIARFTMRDADSHTVVVEAVGNETRGSGRASATMTMTLHERGAETDCAIRTELTVTGKPAQFGRGVMADVSSKLIDQFARRLADEVLRPAQAADPDVTSAVQPPPAGAPQPPAAGAVQHRPQPKLAQRRDDDAIDLLESAGLPVLKRVVPMAALLLACWLCVRALRRR